MSNQRKGIISSTFLFSWRFTLNFSLKTDCLVDNINNWNYQGANFQIFPFSHRKCMVFWFFESTYNQSCNPVKLILLNDLLLAEWIIVKLNSEGILKRFFIFPCNVLCKELDDLPDTYYALLKSNCKSENFSRELMKLLLVISILKIFFVQEIKKHIQKLDMIE